MPEREQIDFVVTWVDGSDPQWLEKRSHYAPGETDNGSSVNRYRDWGLMRYWFRGVETYAPWVHHIYFVTCGHYPNWLNRNHPKLTLVKHRDYIPAQQLPTFNSNVIELYLHRIPGLQEQFVLFNDDMFLMRPVSPEDFFRNGRPCEPAWLDAVAAVTPDDVFPHTILNNFSLINQHFSKKDVLRKNFRKFFTLQYGPALVRNLLLAPTKYFSCFRDPHLPSACLKRTFERVWAQEGARLEGCGGNRFRSREDFTVWLMKEWQICEGNFEPRSIRWGKYFELGRDNETVYQTLLQGKYSAVCLNDSSEDIPFEETKQRLLQVFEQLLPEKSSYEC